MARKEVIINKKHVDTMRHMFEDKFKDPTAKSSGLEKAIRSNGEAAWVCGAAADGTNSACFRQFMEKGHDCIGVLARYAEE